MTLDLRNTPSDGVMPVPSGDNIASHNPETIPQRSDATTYLRRSVSKSSHANETASTELKIKKSASISLAKFVASFKASFKSFKATITSKLEDIKFLLFIAIHFKFPVKQTVNATVPTRVTENSYITRFKNVIAKTSPVTHSDEGVISASQDCKAHLLGKAPGMYLKNFTHESHTYVMPHQFIRDQGAGGTQLTIHGIHIDYASDTGERKESVAAKINALNILLSPEEAVVVSRLLTQSTIGYVSAFLQTNLNEDQESPLTWAGAQQAPIETSIRLEGDNVVVTLSQLHEAIDMDASDPEKARTGCFTYGSVEYTIPRSTLALIAGITDMEVLENFDNKTIDVGRCAFTHTKVYTSPHETLEAFKSLQENSLVEDDTATITEIPEEKEVETDQAIIDQMIKESQVKLHPRDE